MRDTVNRWTARAAALVAGTMLVAGGGVAHAADTTTWDPRGDGHHQVDIRSLHVDHAPRKVPLRATPVKGKFWGDFNYFYVDTRPARPGAEFRVEVNSEGMGYYEVRRWRDGKVGRATCSNLRVDVDSPILRVHVPRRCLDRPDRVRVRMVSDSDFGRGDKAGWTHWGRRG